MNIGEITLAIGIAFGVMVTISIMLPFHFYRVDKLRKAQDR